MLHGVLDAADRCSAQHLPGCPGREYVSETPIEDRLGAVLASEQATITAKGVLACKNPGTVIQRLVGMAGIADMFTYHQVTFSAIGDLMFPGLGGLGGRGGMSPKKMKGMLKNMGINIDELENVTEVIIRMQDREIVLSNASVAVMDAHGQRSYQISGDASERPLGAGAGEVEAPVEIPESDVDLVAAQTGVPAEKARAALEEAKGDLAAAIMNLTSK